MRASDPVRAIPDEPKYFPAVYGVEYKRDYNDFWALFYDTESLERRLDILRDQFASDLFFMVFYGLGRWDINDWGKQTQWIVDVCQEIESGPQTDTLDLWARGHYKSTIITQGRTLQELLTQENLSVGIFSHTRPIAKSFMLPIKTAFESSILLKASFRDVLWADPRRQAPAWSMDDGLVLMRESTSNTNSLEAWGLIDGMPTGKHFGLRVYDDVVTEKSVTTPEMLQKVEDSLRMSDNLGTVEGGRQRFVGTIYHHADPYRTRLTQAQKGVYPWHLRVKPWYDPKRVAKEGRQPVLISLKAILEKRVKQGPYIFACQQELDPTNEEMQTFKRAWLRYYSVLPPVRTKYLFVDPANSKKKNSDYTVMALVSIDAMKNRFLEYLVRDRLNLGERWKVMASIVRQHPDIITVYYERYGKDADCYYHNEQMQREGLFFPLTEIGGQTTKEDRIKRLVPVFEQGKFRLPERLYYNGRDVIAELLDEEFDTFPFSRTDDMLDCIARIEDPGVSLTVPMSGSQTVAYEQAKADAIAESEEDW